MKRAKGDMVMIYEDPVTQKILEGAAILSKHLHTGPDAQSWMVEFLNEPGTEQHRRFIGRDQPTIKLHTAFLAKDAKDCMGRPNMLGENCWYVSLDGAHWVEVRCDSQPTNADYETARKIIEGDGKMRPLTIATRLIRQWGAVVQA